ncbi:sulfatase family protein [Paenibacillus cymbidii]|uniref:sulfatase family protein n=1 Tax=Paenibacillus cymbidii TaxID=1639034 RepID=UPI001080B04C|nr:arylsulfatase [Paenibacillus cymbidii]
MSKQKPNLIYILADDMGYGDISYLNEQSKLFTPNLDRMARQGAAFTDGHSSSAVCTPSRYSILTGRYNWRSALKQGVLNGYSKPLIENGRMTVASLLQAEGYRTACIGKWHLGLEWQTGSDDPTDVDFAKPILDGPLQHGFDYYYGISASLDMPPYVYIENSRVTAQPDRETVSTREEKPMGWWRKGPTGADFRHDEVLSNLTAKTLEKIDEYADRSFFLYFPITAPHTPILPSEPFAGKSGTNLYGDFVLMVDDLVGQIMRKLEDKGIAEQTILIFTSDNGCSNQANFPELASFGHNPSYVFRGHKADIYEGGHRIPLLVQWPERIKAGTIVDEPVCLTDLLATVADLLDVPLPEDAGEDSVSNLGVWLGQFASPLREATVHHSINGSFSIRQGQWKLELCPGSGGWSYPKPGEEPEGSLPIQLYDLSADIGERENVALAHPQIVKQLEQLLEQYVQSGRSTPRVRS